MTRWMRSLKEGPCVDCGNSFQTVAMDWDHREGEEKIGNPCELIKRFSKERILEELSKCDLVCANCHRIRTHKRGVAQSGRAHASGA